MLKINKKMKSLIANSFHKTKINDKLALIVKEGFFERDGCFFLKSLYQSHYDQYCKKQFHDETGFESFVNSINVDNRYNNDSLQMSLKFVEYIFDNMRIFNSELKLLACISSSEEEIIIKFYVQRYGQSYLSDSLNDYNTAILEVSKDGLSDLMRI